MIVDLEQTRHTDLNRDFTREFYCYEVWLGTVRTIVLSALAIFISSKASAYCQKVSGSASCKHSAPNPNLNEETDHFACEEILGQGRIGGRLSLVSMNGELRSSRAG